MKRITELSASGLAGDLNRRAKEITELLKRALAEDLGAGDLTTDAVLPEAVRARGRLIANQVLVIAGPPLAEEVFDLLDLQSVFRRAADEGAQVSRGAVLAEVTGDAGALLRGERTALNFLQRLCGIATLTRRFVARLGESKTKLLDTRKTTPTMRALEKYAVRVGGGRSHRFGLFDAVLIKENHSRMAGGVGEAVRRAQNKHGRGRRVQAEAGSLDDVKEALAAGADSLLLDNMTPEQVRAAVKTVAGRVPVEVSGGISLENIGKYAMLGADFISVGALTHSAPAADISFELESIGE